MASELMRLTDPGGNIAHAEIDINGARVMLADENPQFNTSPQTLGGSAVMIHLYVEDVDAVFDRAVASGSEVILPVTDQFYGDRTGRIKDPFGHIWLIATHTGTGSPFDYARWTRRLTGHAFRHAFARSDMVAWHGGAVIAMGVFFAGLRMAIRGRKKPSN